MAGSPGISPVWCWLLAPAALAANFIASFQWFASAHTIAFWVACYFVFLACKRQGRGDRGEVTMAVVLSGTTLALHGLYQSLIGFDAMSIAGEAPAALHARVASGRAVATLGLPGALAGFLALSLPLTLCRALSADRSRGQRALALVATVAQAAGLAATRSAAGVASLAAAGALVLWWSSTAGRRVVARRLAVALLAAGLAVATLLLATRFSGGGASDEGAGPLALRAGNWKVAAMILADHPLLGAGAGCFGIVFPKYRAWEMNESRFAHNSYLQILAECGLPLGVAALTLAGLLIARLRRLALRPDCGDERFLAISCVAFLLHNLVDFTFFLPTVGFAFVALAGIAVGRTEQEDGPPKHATSLGRTVGAFVLAAFAILVTRADQARELARAVVTEPAIGRVEAVRAVNANPWDPEARSLLSHVLFETGLSDQNIEVLREAEAQAQRAADLDPMTPHHWHQLGRVRLALRDPLGAFIALQRATELYPIKIEYRDDRDRVGTALAREKERR